MTAQDFIVPKLNVYLKSQNISLKFNEAGICNGLSTLYAKYVLENRADEFLDLLNRTANMTPLSYNEEVNEFINDIMRTMEPEIFDKNYNQNTSYKTLAVKNNVKDSLSQMQACFDTSLIAKKETWAELLKDLKLNTSEVMLISIPNHSMALRKVGDKFHLYDPSSLRREVKCNDETAVANYLSYWYFNKGPIALNVRVINNPHVAPRTNFPTLTDLNSKTDNNLTIDFDGENINNLSFFASNSNNEQAIENLLETHDFNELNILEAATNAVINNNDGSLNPLLDKVNSHRLDNLIAQSLMHGRKDSYLALRKHPKFLKQFENIFNSQKDLVNTFIAACASGGDPELLNILLNETTDFNPKEIFNTKVSFNDGNGEIDIIQHAITSDNAKCVRILINKLENINLEDDIKMKYLIQAIKINNPSIAAVLIKELKIGADLVNQLKIPTFIFGKTDCYLLKNLKDTGMIFSSYQQDIYDNKIQHKPNGFMLAIGIILQKFSDYLKGNELSFYSAPNDMEQSKWDKFDSDPVTVVNMQQPICNAI